MKTMGWTISQALEAWDGAADAVSCDKVLQNELAAVVIDSRKVVPGAVFCAIRGERFDAHDFIEEVFKAGALACIVDRKWWQQAGDQHPGRAFLAVEDTLAALQSLATAYRRFLAPHVLAITGTNGKTSTKELVANVLETERAVFRTAGNLNNHIGVPLSLLAMRRPVAVAVIEMGMNHSGEIARLCEIAEPESGLITNIGHGHTEFLGGVEGVRRAKQELFDWLAARDGLAFVNADDAMVVRAAADSGVKKQLTYGFYKRAQVSAEGVHVQENGCAAFRWQGHKIQLGVPGLHNAANALAAVAVGRAFDITAEHIVSALAGPLQIGGRMRRLESAGRIIFDDTYNANPESMRAGIEHIATLRASGRRVAVLADMLELGELSEQAHKEVLDFALNTGLDAVLLYGPQMQQAAAAIGSEKLRWFAEKNELAHALKEITAAGDIILIKGSRGMRMEEVIDLLRSSKNGS